MQEHELTAWLGDAADTTTDEQRAALHRVSDTIAERYKGDDGDAAERAFTAAAMIILGDATLADIGSKWLAARAAEQHAHERLSGALIAASATMSESAMARESGMTRVSIRKALGK